MITLAQLRSWCWPQEPPLSGTASDTELPDLPMFRAMAYRFAPDKYPEFQREYRLLAMREMPQHLALERIARLFEREKLRFAPFKGARLATACYPDPALRSRCDIDLLTPPEESERALEVLKADGWRTPYHYDSPYHHPVMYRQKVALELHFRLPNFAGDAGRQWEIFVPDGEGTAFHLPPEMELLGLFFHSMNHLWSNGVQMLADCGFLLGKFGAPDWRKVREFSREFRVPDPELLFFAFPDFFPAACMPPGPPPERKFTDLLRRRILDPVDFKSNQDALVLNRSDRFSRRWWRERFAGFKPSVLRLTYHLPDRGAYGRLTAAYLRMIGDKFRRVCRGFEEKDPSVISRFREVEALKRYLARTGRD